MSSLSQEDLPVHPGSIINLVHALSSEPLSEQGPFSTPPPLSKHFLLPLLPLPGFAAKQEAAKQEMLFT